MKVRFNKITLIILFVGLVGNTLAQNIWGPNTTDYRRDLHKDQYGTVYGGGLAQLNTQFIVGRESGPTIWRDVYQWNIPDEGIPDNSSIDFVRLVFNYADGSTSSDLFAGFYNISYDMISEDYFTEIFNAMNYTVTPIGSLTGSNHNITFESSDPNSAFNQAIKDMLPNNKFVLGINWGNDAYDNNNNWYIQNISVTLYIEFTPPTKWVTIDQRNSLNQQIGILKKWEWDIDDWGNNFNPGSQFPFDVGSQQVIHGDQAIYSNEKYQKWIRNNSDENVLNHHSFSITPFDNTLTSKFNPTQSDITIKNSLEGTSVSGAKIKFADPWYIDYKDPDYADSVRNRGMKASGPDALQYRERTSPFYPNYNTIYQNNDNGIQDPPHSYQGVFLNQAPDPNDPDKPYYSVQAVSPQDIYLGGSLGTRKFWFHNWSGTNASVQGGGIRAGVVFTSADATVSAILKGHRLSNDQNGISSGSQRKLVRTDNGIYHLVYESLGSVWYTYSLTNNFNGQWSDEIELDAGKNPAIDFEGNIVKIVFERFLPGSDPYPIIRLDTYEPDQGGGYTKLGSEEVLSSYPSEYFGNAKPVIAYTPQVVFIAYRKNTSGGIYQRTQWNLGGSWQWGSEGLISSTNSYSENPTAAGRTANVHLAYEQFNSIKYLYTKVKGTSWEYSGDETISTGSGYDFNHSPSISMAGDYSPVVSWVGYSNIIPPGTLSKGNEVSTDEYVPKVVVRRGYNGKWGSFFKAGTDAVTTNNNSVISSLTEATIIAWSEGTAPDYSSKWVRRTNGVYTDAHSISPGGKQNQVSNGSSLTNIKGLVFSTAAEPFDLALSATDFSVIFPKGELEKPGDIVELSYGREGVIDKTGIEFLFNIGDVIVNDSVIKFIDCPDTVAYSSQTELNDLVRTESFELNPGSEFYFTDFYYVLNQEEADSLLTEADAVSFKVELVNSRTGITAGTFDNITYTKENLEKHNNIGYRVDCSSIVPGDYFLRLVTSVDGEAEYFLGNVQNTGEGLSKGTYTQINFDGTKLPESYDLSQNFPNPFNPTTTINYQIPQTGFVTLKVYDILGKEVTTLVNEQKNQGRYSVNFDASRLASGVYIYQLRVNDYVSSKKMLLLK